MGKRITREEQNDILVGHQLNFVRSIVPSELMWWIKKNTHVVEGKIEWKGEHPKYVEPEWDEDDNN